MKTNLISFKHLVLAVAVGSGALLFDDQALTSHSGRWTTAAEARIGRPLTPMSYAGVARRTTRRAAAVGAAGAAAYGAYGYAGSGCTQAVDAYGRIYAQCP